MRLDTPTLLLMTVAVTAVVGVLFLLSWSQARHTRALAIWGVAHLLGAAGAALLSLRNVISDALSIGLGNALMLGAYGLIWCGVRAFQHRPPRYGVAAAVGCLWSLACLWPDFMASLSARVIFISVFAGAFCALGAYTLWRGRSEALVSRWPAMTILAVYAALYWLRIPIALGPTMPADTNAMESPWFAVLCFGGTLFTVAIAFVFMALTKERAEHEQRLAAETDPLTGVPNRRAFVVRAEKLLAARDRPCVLLLFDLDHFKAINDTYGHAVGDGVLAGFCHAIQALLPAGAAFGRMGGEEFACVVPDMATEPAMRLADRFRAVLAAIDVPAYRDLRIQTSIGLATARAGEQAAFEAMLRAADDALYSAKRAGRDRVVAACPLGERLAA
ncbi:GGDEF domain-containing protein [Methylobacterium organophilum]|uniref:GGDEF domain-containing protein n=1 Tax=Methylobacterium organophilum TaxID=410 RepID=UPI001F1349EF|nr:GGDEF domain-containing protein [Methylobacterium organophilum]UMY18226.1 GGDEF domain-containing protein [Methylobacterium organophilum]